MFGMGCFWGAERKFWQAPGRVHHRGGLRGRLHAEPDLRGGLLGHDRPHRGRARRLRPRARSPTRSCCGSFWEGHDPTQGMRQGNDVGTQYRSAIYRRPRRSATAAEASREAYQERLHRAGYGEITTEIAAGAPRVLLRRGLPPAVPGQEPERLLRPGRHRPELPGRPPDRGLSPSRVHWAAHMTSLWPRLEPLLAKVQKPARYIGCEDGAAGARPRPGQVAWLLVYPDTYEIGLPNQGLQILYEILNERADAVAERSYAPWTDLEARAAARTACRCSRSTPTARPATSTSRLQPVGRARLHQRPELHRPGRRARPGRRPPARAPARRRRRPLHLQPRAAGRLRRLLRARRRRGGRRRDHRGRRRRGRPPGAPRAAASRCCARWPTIPGVYVPSMYEVDLRRRRPRRGHARATPTCPRGSRSARSPTWPSGPTPSSQLVPLTEVVHDRLNVEVFRGCTRGCRFCQAGHDHPPGAGAPGRPGAHDGARRPAAHRLRRGGPHLAVHRRLLAASSGSSPTPSTTPPAAASVSVSLPQPAGRRLHRRHRRRDPEGPPHRPHLRPRGRHAGACARSSTS